MKHTSDSRTTPSILVAPIVPVVRGEEIVGGVPGCFVRNILRQHGVIPFAGMRVALSERERLAVSATVQIDRRELMWVETDAARRELRIMLRGGRSAAVKGGRSCPLPPN